MNKKFNDIKLKDRELKMIGNYSYYKYLSDASEEEFEWVESKVKKDGWTFKAKKKEENRIIYCFRPKADCLDCHKCSNNECGDGICCDAWEEIEKD